MGGVGNVGENVAAEGGAVGEELGDEVGEVDGCVDADGGEGCSAVHSWWEGRWGKGFELFFSDNQYGQVNFVTGVSEWLGE